MSSLAMTRRSMLVGCGCAVMSGSAFAQDEGEVLFQGRICAENFGTSAFRGRVTNVGDPAPEASSILRSILDVAGIQHDILLRAADIERNARAFATIRNGTRYIVYDRKQHDWGSGKANWFDVKTMGHEVGHHVASHTAVSEYGKHKRELEADFFAGYALARLGAPREKIERLFWDWEGTAWHPGGLKRKATTMAGFDQAERLKRFESSRLNPTCKPGWSTDEIDIDGTTCRIANQCEGGQSIQRMACQDYDGIWRWMRKHR